MQNDFWATKNIKQRRVSNLDNKIKDNILGKLIIVIWIILFMLSSCGLIVEASPTQEIEPQPDQYFELKAKTIQNVNGRKASNNGTLGT